jgi:phospholipid transport system transporter-binding protein
VPAPIFTLALPAQLTLGNAAQALGALHEQVRGGGGPVGVDASRLQSFDSAAIATLLELRREAGTRGFHVTGAPPAMVELAGLYGVADLLGFEARAADQSIRA